MGMTIVEKILSRSSGQAKAVPGDLVVVAAETTVMIDTSFYASQRRPILKVHETGIAVR